MQCHASAGNAVYASFFQHCRMVVYAVLLLPGLSYATKPCPPSLCFDEHHRFNEQQCRNAVDWIAVGTISDVVHQYQGLPLDTDFAKFTLNVQRWEKGGEGQAAKLHLQVPWCAIALPKNTAGILRFYGVNHPERGVRYVHFERLKN